MDASFKTLLVRLVLLSVLTLPSPCLTMPACAATTFLIAPFVALTRRRVWCSVPRQCGSLVPMVESMCSMLLACPRNPNARQSTRRSPRTVVTASGLVMPMRQLWFRALTSLGWSMILVHSFLNGMNTTLKPAAVGMSRHPL